ncbi:MAG TPA: EthD family reductase [Candidatus Polarisedimenticolia bacterium]|nr:EthD family reductase [Candidatus Polarisedimenticolia bacterium]
MSAKFLVLYPTPSNPEQFDGRYEGEHLPMGKANLVGASGLASYRILGSPAGKSPFARLTAVTFPSLKALQDCAALPGAKKTIAHAVEISTGGAPHFMIVEEEG